MKNFKNYLKEITINEQCLAYLQSELQERYSFALVKDLFSLPCMQYETKHKMAMILAMLEDGEVNDVVIDWLTQLLSNIPGELWHEYEDRSSAFVETNFHILSRRQVLSLAHSVEMMYAKGYNTFRLLMLIYQRISLSDNEFNPYSYENVRIKLAKLAYSTSAYNLNSNLAVVKGIKRHLKESRNDHLLGLLNYYKGVCLGAAKCKIDYKDSKYFILKAKSMGFELASIYLDYRGNNSETSKEC